MPSQVNLDQSRYAQVGDHRVRPAAAGYPTAAGARSGGAIRDCAGAGLVDLAFRARQAQAQLGDTLKRLADGLKVSIDYLFGRTKNPQAHEDDTDKYAPNVLLTPKEVEAVEDWLKYVKERPRDLGGR